MTHLWRIARRSLNPLVGHPSTSQEKFDCTFLQASRWSLGLECLFATGGVCRWRDWYSNVLSFSRASLEYQDFKWKYIKSLNEKCRSCTQKVHDRNPNPNPNPNLVLSRWFHIQVVTWSVVLVCAGNQQGRVVSSFTLVWSESMVACVGCATLDLSIVFTSTRTKPTLITPLTHLLAIGRWAGVMGSKRDV